MPAASDPDPVGSASFENAAPTSQEVHLSRIAHWADSWAEHFRSDSNRELDISQRLLTEIVEDKNAGSTSPNSTV